MRGYFFCPPVHRILYFRRMKTNFYPIDESRNQQLKYAIIGSRYKFDKWIFVRHKQRTTWEIPAGHIEKNEHPDNAAKRELYEETGAKKYRIYPLMDYAVTEKETKTYGRIYMAEVDQLQELPDFEIEEIKFFADLPQLLTYPDIQTIIFKQLKNVIQPK